MPAAFRGVQQIPLHGQSLVAGWDDAGVRTRTRPQYFEQIGHRGLWKDGWKAVTYHLKGVPFDKDEWALYNLDDDFSESHDLSKELPEKLKEMVNAWWEEAEAYGVLPLDDRTLELFGGPPRPGTPHHREQYVYYPPISHIPADASPAMGGRSWSVSCEVIVDDSGCEGVLYARGSHNVGHVFFIKDRKLQFDYNALGKHYRAVGDLDLKAGAHELEAKFEREGRGGRLTLLVDGKEVGSTEVGTAVRMLGSTGVDVGRNGLSPVVDDCEPPFPFTAHFKRITFRSTGRRSVADVEAAARTEMGTE